MTAIRRIRIAAVKARLLDSIAHHPDAFEARDRQWQKLHRLQTAQRGAAVAL